METKMLYLYHGTTSVCAIKARLALHEKGLEWDGEILDLHRGDQHRPEYLQLNPNGVVPTLVHAGRVIIESTLIIESLDESFPDQPLMPSDPFQRAKVRLWMKKIDDTCTQHVRPSPSRLPFVKGSSKEHPRNWRHASRAYPIRLTANGNGFQSHRESPRRMWRTRSRITTNTSVRWKRRSADRLISSARVTRWRTWRRLRTSIAPRW